MFAAAVFDASECGFCGVWYSGSCCRSVCSCNVADAMFVDSMIVTLFFTFANTAAVFAAAVFGFAVLAAAFGWCYIQRCFL